MGEYIQFLQLPNKFVILQWRFTALEILMLKLIAQILRTHAFYEFLRFPYISIIIYLIIGFLYTNHFNLNMFLNLNKWRFMI